MSLETAFPMVLAVGLMLGFVVGAMSVLAVRVRHVPRVEWGMPRKIALSVTLVVVVLVGAAVAWTFMYDGSPLPEQSVGSQ